MASDLYPIAGLDMATSTGWSLLRSPGAGIEFGHKPFHGGNDGVVGQNLHDWLEAFAAINNPATVYAEDVFLRGHSTIRLCGFRMLLNMTAARHGFLVRFVEPRRLKKHFTGNGNADKNQMIARCRELGLHPENDDEADAIALLMFGLDSEDPGEAANRLFAA